MTPPPFSMRSTPGKPREAARSRDRPGDISSKGRFRSPTASLSAAPTATCHRTPTSGTGGGRPGRREQRSHGGDDPRSAGSHQWIRPGEDGTAFLVTGGKGSEDAAPFVTLHTDSSIGGMTIQYPDQTTKGEPLPYPWTIAIARLQLRGLRHGIAQSVSGHQHVRCRASQHPQPHRPAAPPRHPRLRDPRHRPHRKRPLQRCWSNPPFWSGSESTASASSSAAPIGNTCSTPSAWATKPDTSSSEVRAACATATSSASGPTPAFAPWSSSSAPRSGF